MLSLSAISSILKGKRARLVCVRLLIMEEDNNTDGSVGVIGVKCVDAGYDDRGVQ